MRGSRQTPESCSPALTALSRMILKQAETTMFATCFYVVADVERGELRFANAGHPSALHVRSGGRLRRKARWPGGARPGHGNFSLRDLRDFTRSMAKGDLIMLFTDGLFEVEDATGASSAEE